MSKIRKVGIMRTVTTKPAPRDHHSLRERTWEAKSENSEGVAQFSGMRIENTYKVSPEDDRRFKPGKVETVMQDVLREHLTDVDYDKSIGQRMSKMIADTIKTRVKEFRWNRYKLVVHVTIGENREQEIVSGSRFLWFDETDTYASTKFVNKTIFAMAVCYGIYYE